MYFQQERLNSLKVEHLNHLHQDLIDPVTKKLTEVVWETWKDEATGENRGKRIAVESGVEVPIPFVTGFEGRSAGPRDTSLADVEAKTYTPSLLGNPLPVLLYNEMLRLRRKKKENQLL